jgi:glycerophosphoryl diester phosphodiesterase
MFLRIGHRGAKAYETENTIAGFRRAIELGVNAIEFDVRQTKDGKLVVIHDESLKRVFGVDATVREKTLRALKQLTGEGIPTLEEALHFIDGKVEKILVELKEEGHEKKVIDAVRHQELRDRVIVISFHEEVIGNVRALDARIATGLVYSKHKRPIDAALKLSAQYLVALYRFVHSRDIEKAHKSNLGVIVWTINTEKEAKEYIAKGVDGIASDKPDIFKGA